jgi:hypothetical protein
MSTAYRCVFKFWDSAYQTAVPSIADVSLGFWVDEAWEFTKSSDCKFWIPPSNIYYVEKVAE